MVGSTYISWTHDSADLLHRVEIWAQSPMHREDFLINDCSNRQAIEAIGKGLPQFDVIPSFALIVEPIDTIDGSTFVIATKDEEIFGILDFVGKEQTDRLQRLLSSIHIVTQEEVISLGREASVFEETQQIIILAVNITTYLQALKVSCRLSPSTKRGKRSLD